MNPSLTGQQVHDAQLTDWRQLWRALYTRFDTGSFVAGQRLLTSIGEAAEEAGHHPDLDLRYGHLDVRLMSHDVGGLTQRDIDLARRISVLAAEAGITARPHERSLVEIGLDTDDPLRIAPFWRAVLDRPAEAGEEDEILDPAGSGPTLWFQGTDAHETPRQRFHLDVWVPHDVAEQRVRAALDAGGSLVTDAHAPSFWVLADADGNQACVCTWQDRSSGGTG